MRGYVIACSLIAILLVSSGRANAASCAADLDSSGSVTAADLAILLGAWGPNPGSPADLDGDDVVNAADLAELLGAWGKVCVDGVVVTHLAGNALDQYPHFEYVRAFNMNESFDVAIDPSRFPIVAGKTCNLYIVQSRTFDQWLADQSLSDVRGGPQAVTLAGSTIQDLTVTVADGDTLLGNAGTGVGVPYDVVLDCNQNGVLDDGDLIDGDYAGGPHGSRDGEAGMYVVHDLTQLGPLATTGETFTFQLLTGTTSQQRIFYPSDIQSMEPLPLIVIGHGGGHNFTWYDYLQEHLASYGYIVTSHPNSFPFPPSVQQVLLHTDAIIGRQDVVLDGVLSGKIDDSRIAWIGHSLGGRAVLLGFDLLEEGSFVPQNYGPDDVRLLCGIASNSIDGPNDADPHDTPFHLMFGSADGDISGSPSCDQCQPLRHVDRADGFRQSTYIQGADHNDFNCCGFPNFTGPARTEIGQEESQRIAKAVYLALMKHYLEGNIPSKDYLWRQWEQFRPIGVSDETIVVNGYGESPDAGKLIIDDYQTQISTSTSSSGGAVTFDVANVFEGQLNDTNSSFAWQPSDPMNGMTHAGSSDDSMGVVFDWTLGVDRFMEFEVPTADADFSQFVYISLRACQGTRHPETVAELGDLAFTVTLIDGSGDESSIRIDAFGGGIEEPYPRTGFGAGAGWQNEFETIRIRLTDFLNNASDLDLTDIAAIRLEFGASFGSARGRLGLDDVELTTD